MRGNTRNMNSRNRAMEVLRRIQKAWVRPPFSAPMITAKTSSTAVSVRMVPPTAMATAWCLLMPNFDTIGYATKVCVENMMAVRKLAASP
jgi:hypothetical protein